MNSKVAIRTLTVSTFVSLALVGAADIAAVANAATVHAGTHTVSIASPDDGGAGNG